MSVEETSSAEVEKNYLKTGADVEQALNAIKIVKAFGQENYEISKYDKHLRADDKNQNKRAWLYGFSLGLLEITYFL